MNRLIEHDFQRWADNTHRKPLVVWGARQIGKTTAVRQWSTRRFSRFTEINFQEKPSFKTAFAGDLDPATILRNLEVMIDRAIERDGREIVFFDEIQECPEALTSLKYFFEKCPSLPVVAAGSLLGIRMAGTPFPVGKVDLLHMYPMSFGEFLQASAPRLFESYREALERPKSLPRVAHERLWIAFKNYMATGGLPEVVHTWIVSGGREAGMRAFDAARAKSQVLLAGYLSDIAKHAGKQNAMHIERVWKSVPTQLAAAVDGSTRRFHFKDVIPGLAAYRDLAGAIDWLSGAGLIVRRPICHSAELPLAAFTQENMFKLHVFDIGVLGTMLGLGLKVLDSYEMGTYKGYLVESFVAQELIATHPDLTTVPPLHAWNEGRAEIEFVLESPSGAVPVEVKSGSRLRAKSLKSFIDRRHPAVSIVVSAREYSDERDGERRQVNIPHYLVGRVWREIVSRV